MKLIINDYEHSLDQVSSMLLHKLGIELVKGIELEKLLESLFSQGEEKLMSEMFSLSEKANYGIFNITAFFTVVDGKIGVIEMERIHSGFNDNRNEEAGFVPASEKLSNFVKRYLYKYLPKTPITKTTEKFYKKLNGFWIEK